MSDELVRFLRARLDEDEWAAQVAKDAAAKRTHYRASMIASADRDLRDVEAKRRIIDVLVEEGGDRMFADIFRLLALRYADHADYDQAWRP